MKLILAYALYFIGDAVGHLLLIDCLSRITYPIYNKCMIWSSDLDVEGKVWQYPKHNE
jgi:hypothetical protein